MPYDVQATEAGFAGMPDSTPVAIASGSPHTVEAGRQLAAMGGNAVDIAVGSALTAAVAEALMCSLGGSAFIHIKLPGRPPELIDGGDAMPMIPEAVRQSEQKAWKSATLPYGDGVTIQVGHASVAVPGMLRGLELAWQRHGTLPWPEVVSPAIAAAKAGIRATETAASWLSIAGRAVFFDQKESRDTFFPDGKTALQPGQHYRPPHLDSALELVARQGADALYRGELGKAFVEEIGGNGGYVTLDDLAAYQARVRQPLVLRSHGYQLALNPPPSIGGAMVGSMVQLFDARWRPDLPVAERNLAVARVQRTMFSLRKQEGSGPWSDERAGSILERPFLERFFEKTFSPNTMHMSVATGDGTVVAITMSNGYGSGISIPGTGITTNNSLGEPELNPAGYFRIPRGGRLVSNMSPTVVWHQDGTTLAMGSPGASRITTSVFQGWIRLAYDCMGMADMVRAPRLHMENVDGELVAQYEPGIDVSLVGEHFRLRAFEAPDMYFGALNVAGIDGQRRLHAVADTRRQGAQHVSATEIAVPMSS
jgi:gamma-glutamyltranspeptidase/glutathione hydrolase